MSVTNETTLLAKEAAGAIPLRSSAPTSWEVVEQTIRGILAQYERDMALNRIISAEDGVTHQMTLLRAIKMAIRQEGVEFNAAWNMLLKWAATHLDGLMSVSARFRFMDYAKRMPERDRAMFKTLIHLMTITADPRTRQASIKRYNFGRLYKFFDKDDTANKLEGFYLQ